MTNARPLTGEYITLEDGYDDAWVCICGKTAHDSGFEPCLKNGEVFEPVEGGPWDGHLYKCMECGRIIDQKSHAVIGSDAAFLAD